MFGIAGSNHHIRSCGSEGERLGGEDHIDIEVFEIGCWTPLLPRICPKLCRYEAMLASGQTLWSVGDRVRVYRKRNGGCGLLEESDEGHLELNNVDLRDYDVDYYSRQLRQTFASRFACAFSSGDYEPVFADPDQMTLFMPALTMISTVLEKKLEAKAEAS